MRGHHSCTVWPAYVTQGPQQSTGSNLGHFAARLESDGPGCLAEHATLEDRMKGLWMFKSLNGLERQLFTTHYEPQCMKCLNEHVSLDERPKTEVSR